MRLFIALNFDEKTKDSICKVQESLIAESISGNFSTRDNLHITLAFLGEVKPERVETLGFLLDSLSTETFYLQLSGMGSFGNDPRKKTVWLGMKKNPVLFRLAEDLRVILRKGGYPLDEKEFVAHLTLGREVCMENESESLQKIKKSFPPILFIPRKISLMESCRINGKTIYREISKKTIGKKPSPKP